MNIEQCLESITNSLPTYLLCFPAEKREIIELVNHINLLGTESNRNK